MQKLLLYFYLSTIIEGATEKHGLLAAFKQWTPVILPNAD